MEFLFALITLILVIVPLWRIFKRAGFNPFLSLLVIIPILGPIIVSCVLSFAEWPASKKVEGK